MRSDGSHECIAPGQSLPRHPPPHRGGPLNGKNTRIRPVTCRIGQPTLASSRYRPTCLSGTTSPGLVDISHCSVAVAQIQHRSMAALICSEVIRSGRSPRARRPASSLGIRQQRGLTFVPLAGLDQMQLALRAALLTANLNTPPACIQLGVGQSMPDPDPGLRGGPGRAGVEPVVRQIKDPEAGYGTSGRVCRHEAAGFPASAGGRDDTMSA